MSELDPHGITFVVHGMKGGGGERIAADLANHWARTGRKVALVTHTIEADEHYAVHKQIERIALSDIEPAEDTTFSEGWAKARWRGEEELHEKLRMALNIAGNRSVIVFMNRMAVRTLLADYDNEYDIWISEQNYPPMYTISGYLSSLRRKLYPQARGLVVLTERTKNEWARNIIEESRIHVIPNFLPEHDFDSLSAREVSEKYIFACGRLVRQKGFDLLLNAYAKALKNSWDPLPVLKIAGEGELLADLKNQARELGIEKQVAFLGRRSDVIQLMSDAVCFVLSSRHEGLPLALLEAMASGAPVISFNCPTGPDEIITNNVDGILVECSNTDRLAAAIANLCSDEKLRTDLAARALNVRSRYSLRRMATMWENAIWSDNE